MLTTTWAVAATPALGAPRRPKVRVLPASVAADCSVDVTNSVAGWIQESPNGSTVRLGKNACYRVDGTVALVDRRHLTIDGNGATLRAVAPPGASRPHVVVQGGSHVTIRDLTVEGNNPGAGAVKSAYQPQFESQHGFSFLGVHHALLDRVAATKVHGDFVYIGSTGKEGDPSYRWSDDVRVTRSTFSGSGRQGISITAGKNVRIDHDEIGGVPRSLFDFESNTAAGGAIDVVVEHNSTGAAVNFWLANKGAGLNTKRIVFDRNTMEQPTGGLVFVFGPTSGYRGPFTFTRNAVQFADSVHDEGSKGAFFFAGAQGVTVTKNTGTFPGGQTVPVVECRGCADVTVDANLFPYAGQPLVQVPRPGQVPASD